MGLMHVSYYSLSSSSREYSSGVYFFFLFLRVVARFIFHIETCTCNPVRNA